MGIFEEGGKMVKITFGYRLGTMLRETGQALDRVGCRIQGNFVYGQQINRQQTLQRLFTKYPQVIQNESFVAENASLIGDVRVGKNSAIWYGAVLRGDSNEITIGNNTSIGDNCVLHGSSGQGLAASPAPTVVGNNVLIESSSTIHGCQIKDNAVVRSGSIVFQLHARTRDYFIIWTTLGNLVRSKNTNVVGELIHTYQIF